MEFFANLLSKVADSLSVSPACIWWFWDEPECPEELLK